MTYHACPTHAPYDGSPYTAFSGFPWLRSLGFRQCDVHAVNCLIRRIRTYTHLSSGHLFGAIEGIYPHKWCTSRSCRPSIDAPFLRLKQCASIVAGTPWSKNAAGHFVLLRQNPLCIFHTFFSVWFGSGLPSTNREASKNGTVVLRGFFGLFFSCRIPHMSRLCRLLFGPHRDSTACCSIFSFGKHRLKMALRTINSVFFPYSNILSQL